MIIKFFALIRDYTGSKEISVEGCHTLRELLNKLCSRYGKSFSEKLFAGDRLSEDIIILVNGRHIEHLKGLDTGLEENDEISIFPRIAGG
ncbi:MAG TPA: MoaD family protein [Bacillota bacterium]|jgi:molybdopterin synthase sulfur carrier subunit|nr:MoaD family protein [Bacillota bacterium]HRS21323.1 MoaD family protein [Clostridia bacterium]HQE65314.1 MoaD family protein [Bacillota bacterium]HQI15486.1 MoaD family protein [Bacillota bacterium]HQJ37274.1 MoaD family protein [Bacillota bacterium]